METGVLWQPLATGQVTSGSLAVTWKAIYDLVNRLITEHGSAAIKEERLALMAAP